MDAKMTEIKPFLLLGLAAVLILGLIRSKHRVTI